MPGTFNNSTYEIYWRKDQTATPNEPVSPSNDMAVSPKSGSMNLRRGAITAAGLVVAKRGLNTLRTEIVATTGNERLETQINNAMQGLGYAAAIGGGAMAGGPAGAGIAAGLVTADAVFNAITFMRDNTRQNRMNEIQRKLNGRRINVASGSVYYD